MTEHIRFNDKALDEVVQRSAILFSNFQKNLDQTSADIKNLENWLEIHGIRVSLFINIPSEAFSIGWDNSYDENWRLICKYPSDYNGGDESRPLIEMPVRARLLCRPYLPTLVQKLAELIPEQRSAQETGNDTNMDTTCPELGSFKKREAAAPGKSHNTAISRVNSSAKVSTIPEDGYSDDLLGL